MPEQQREPGEQAVRGQGHGQPNVLQGRQQIRHAAAGDEDEVETVENDQLDGLGRRVAAGVASCFVAADVHRRQQPRTAAQGRPSLGVEKTVQHYAKQLLKEFTISQVSKNRKKT